MNDRKKIEGPLSPLEVDEITRIVVTAIGRTALSNEMVGTARLMQLRRAFIVLAANTGHADPGPFLAAIDQVEHLPVHRQKLVWLEIASTCLPARRPAGSGA